jgi:hypothetical protein
MDIQKKYFDDLSQTFGARVIPDPQNPAICDVVFSDGRRYVCTHPGALTVARLELTMNRDSQIADGVEFFLKNCIRPHEETKTRPLDLHGTADLEEIRDFWPEFAWRFLRNGSKPFHPD